MTISTRPETQHVDFGLGRQYWSDDARYDDGLEHPHHWARDRQADGVITGHATVADAASVRTPSTVLHDDLHHA